MHGQQNTCKEFSNISKYIPFPNCSFFQRNFLDVDFFQSYTQKGSRSIANWKKKCEDWTVSFDHCLAMTSIFVYPYSNPNNCDSTNECKTAPTTGDMVSKYHVLPLIIDEIIPESLLFKSFTEPAIL